MLKWDILNKISKIKNQKEEKFIDYNAGVETLSDEEAIKLVKEIIAKVLHTII